MTADLQQQAMHLGQMSSQSPTPHLKKMSERQVNKLTCSFSNVLRSFLGEPRAWNSDYVFP
jgi:hypothetical protein